MFDSYADPNARCPVCGDEVFFYQAPSGGRVFFDELGPPWPKHPCTDNPRSPVRLVGPAPARRMTATGRRLAGWQVEGWIPIQIVSSNNGGAIDCVTWEGGYREFRVFPEVGVRITGVAVAAMQPWDDGGHSVISYVELDIGAGARVVRVSRSAPSQMRYIVEQLLKVVVMAETEADVVEPAKVAPRMNELAQRMETWAQHLSAEDAGPYWARFQAAKARAEGRVLEVEGAIVAELEIVASELERLVAAADWDDAEDRLESLCRRWRAAERSSVSGQTALVNRCLKVEASALTQQRKAKKARLKAERLVVKLQVIDELDALAETDDWTTADQRYSSLTAQWKRTGHFKAAEEAALAASFQAAETRFFERRSQVLEDAARRREARDRRKRIVTKQRLVAELRDLPATTDWTVPHRWFDAIEKEWGRLGHSHDDGELELSVEYDAARTAYLAARDDAMAELAAERESRQREARQAELEQVVLDAEVIARAPYWDRDAFELLSSRWKLAGPASDPALHRRFQDAYLVARGVGFRDAIIERIEIVAAVERLVDLADMSARLQLLDELAERWNLAAWAGPDIEATLENRFQTAIRRL